MLRDGGCVHTIAFEDFLKQPLLKVQARAEDVGVVLEFIVC